MVYSKPGIAHYYKPISCLVGSFVGAAQKQQGVVFWLLGISTCAVQGLWYAPVDILWKRRRSSDRERSPDPNPPRIMSNSIQLVLSTEQSLTSYKRSPNTYVLEGLDQLVECEAFGQVG